jgi:hypothetical protein
MRIIVLTILFAGIFIFFNQEDKISYSDKSDSLKVKVSAPRRFERVLPDSTPEAPASAVEEIELNAEVLTAETRDVVDPGDVEHVEEFQWTDLEEGWNNELKEMLLRLEPAEGEAIHKSYLLEQESYQAELESLMNEKQQKTTPEATIEVDNLIDQLDEKHQTKLKELLGAHYEAVRDGYESYMEQAQPDQ